jgi:hypothetical protein
VKALKSAPRASFKASPRASNDAAEPAVAARVALATACVQNYCADVNGSQSHLQDSSPETGSQSQFQGIVTKRASGALSRSTRTISLFN